MPKNLAWLLLLPMLLLSACGTQVSSSADDDCTSHYLLIAKAATLPALKRHLVHGVVPGGRSIRVVDRHDGDLVVNILDRDSHNLMQVEVRQLHAGGWVARQWAQCTD